MMHLVIGQPSTKLDDLALSPAVTKQDLFALFGSFSRQKVIPCSMSKGGSRTAYVYDELGLLFYHDEPEDTVSHLVLALSAADTPEKPAKAFCGDIDFHGAVVDHFTLEKAFLREHGKSLSGHHGHYSRAGADCSCWFLFGKSKSRPPGKKTSLSTLLSVQITFSEQRGA